MPSSEVRTSFCQTSEAPAKAEAPPSPPLPPPPHRRRRPGTVITRQRRNRCGPGAGHPTGEGVKVKTHLCVCACVCVAAETVLFAVCEAFISCNISTLGFLQFWPLVSFNHWWGRKMEWGRLSLCGPRLKPGRRPAAADTHTFQESVRKNMSAVNCGARHRTRRLLLLLLL